MGRQTTGKSPSLRLKRHSRDDNGARRQYQCLVDAPNAEACTPRLQSRADFFTTLRRLCDGETMDLIAALMDFSPSLPMLLTKANGDAMVVESCQP